MRPADLAVKTCVPCRGGTPPLSPEQARAYHAATPQWTLTPDATRLSRTFTFKDFKEAMAFVNRVADVAEAEGHHPDLAIHWNRVDVELWTHSIGGLHENDFIVAAKIDRLS
ncbi:MAG: 4a-hydroxytetrahydrobiopterin dehydratase [Gemmatimonadales bacterium]